MNKYRLDPIKESKKYCHLMEFYSVLPKLRKDIRYTLNNFDYSKNHIVYLILAIIDLCNFRIGNEKYKSSTGTATLRTRNIMECSSNTSNTCNHLVFNGKRQVLNECEILNTKINKILMSLTEYKNDDDFVFTYITNGSIHKVIASDVNELLENYGNISTKMFRTWKANYYFIKHIEKLDLPQNKTQMRKNISQTVEYVAKKLHHTKNICRRSYIDSRIIDLYKESPQYLIDVIRNSKNNNITNSYILETEEALENIISNLC
jgi:DNA topoisomerase IB